MAARSIVIYLLALGLLAGCTMPSETATTSAEKPIDGSTYKIHVIFTAASVQADQNFTFPMQVDGTVVTHSPHIGAHMGLNHVEAAQASKTTYAIACKHVESQIPNDFDVTCTAPHDPGTYYLRGHAQETRGETVTNWWSDEVSFQVHK